MRRVYCRLLWVYMFDQKLKMLIRTNYRCNLKRPKYFILYLFVAHITTKHSSYDNHKCQKKSVTTFHGLTQIIQQSNQSGDTSIIRPKSSAQVRVHLP